MNKEQRKFRKVMKQRKRHKRIASERRIGKIRARKMGVSRTPGMGGLGKHLLSFVGRAPGGSSNGRMDVMVDKKPRDHRSIGH